MTETRNPVNFLSLLPLLPAEKEFARCLAKGRPCKIGSGYLSLSASIPNEQIESGEGANVVRGEVIRFFAYGGNAENPVRGSVIDLRGAWIFGLLDLTNASIPYALMFGNCHFDAVVKMRNVECAALDLNGSHLARGLYADALTTKSSVNFRHDFSAEGVVVLLHANIGGDLDCMGGRFRNLGGYALFADRMTVKGSVNFRDGFLAEGEVRLAGANIGGDLDCMSGKFHNLGGHALVADRVTVKGSVNFRDGFSAEGEVRLAGANIGGDLDCMRGEFHNLSGNALFADGLTIKGGVNLRNGFLAEGEVRLVGANIGRGLDCMGGKFHNPGGNALTAERSAIGGILLWWKTACEGIVNLAYARANELADDSDSWKSCEVDLEGFTYNRFTHPKDASFRIDWLAKRPAGKEFSSQPYEQAAKSMERRTDVQDILRKMRRLEQEYGKDSWLQRAWDRTMSTLRNFVYRPLRTVKWTFSILLAGAVFFGVAAHYNQIAPHQPAILASDKYQKGLVEGNSRMEAVRTMFPDYPEFNPLVFSLDVFIPFFALHQEPFWYPAAGSDDNFWILLFLLTLSLIMLGIAMLVVWLFRRCRRIGEDSACNMWAAAGMAVVLLEIAVAAAAGAAHILFDAESVLWLANSRWLMVWYWLEIIAGGVLTSLFLLSVSSLLRPPSRSHKSSDERD